MTPHDAIMMSHKKICAKVVLSIFFSLFKVLSRNRIFLSTDIIIIGSATCLHLLIISWYCFTTGKTKRGFERISRFVYQRISLEADASTKRKHFSNFLHLRLKFFKGRKFISPIECFCCYSACVVVLEGSEQSTWWISRRKQFNLVDH